MKNSISIKHKTKALVFDQYGTVVDIQKDLTKKAASFLKRKGWNGDPHRFVTWWRRTHFERSMINSLSRGEHTSYRQISHWAVSHVMDRAEISYTESEAAWLVSQIESLKPFPDVINSLQRLRNANYRLAILSNGDVDMLEASKPHIGFKFDETISVQKAGYFKPHWKTYAKAVEILGEKSGEILFVANHAFDCIGAKSFGMLTAFIDRRNRPFGQEPQQPDIIVKTFKELADDLT